MPSDFVHLHVHTEFSLLDGQSKISHVMKRAQELEMPAVGISDHGVMFGVIDFAKKAESAGIKPVIGMEAYLAPRGMQDRDAQHDKRPYHLLLWAENQVGYRNLLKIASASQLDGYYYRPRIDRAFLADHAEGIIATSGCLAAQVPRLLEEQGEERAREMIGWYQEVFGAENFFLELQPHDIAELKRLNAWLLQYRKSGHTPVQLLATNDMHYVRASDTETHDVLLAIQTGALVKETNRMRLSPLGSYYMKSADEMRQAFAGIDEDLLNEAFANTLAIAERCKVSLKREKYHLPLFPVPQGMTEGAYLRHLAFLGLSWRFPNRENDPILQERLERELFIIDDLGFNTYFLIVWDLCMFARSADIWWNVRGSGAGSLVAYCLGITNLDPIQNSLLFERFLNPGRKTMPDIDLDYPDDRRGEMIAYAVDKYGEDKVAAIITFGTMGAKAAVRDVARVLDVPLDKVNRAVKLIPTEAKQKPIMEYVEAEPDLKRMYQTDPELRRAIDTAVELQGLTRHASTHAAGVIIADAPLVEYLPLHRITGTDPSGGSLKSVTQFPMETAEEIGLLKVDFLGLSTLTILRKACELIERHHGIRYTMDNIPYRHDDDNISDEQRAMLDRAFEMMGRGDTVGVFQVESSGMQSMLRDMRPKTFEHIIAGISLYRPGPMDFIPLFNRRMHGEEAVHYHHERLAGILKETYGIMVYQEQLMQIAGEMFGYSLGEADLMRRAVSKKKDKDLLEHRALFRERAPQNGISVDVADKIFDDIVFFANYGFNKCVVGETQIVDADTGRYVTVEDLYYGRVTLSKTLSLDTETLQIGAQAVTDVMFNGVKPVYRLTTRTGRTIEATDNHPFYTFEGWKLLRDVAIGEHIAGARWAVCPSEIAETDETHILWDEVVEVVYVGEKPTYDLTIENTHNFIANGIVVHNSHASDYAVITVQTAYLKCHYPHEYMTALLSVQFDDSDKVATFLEECRRLNIPILPPDINASQLEFDIERLPDGRRGVRFGLSAVKNAGVNALNVILEARREGGAFTSLLDLCHRVDLHKVGKRALECLIKVGALEAFGERDILLESLERIMTASTTYHKAKQSGQKSLFGEEVNVGMSEVTLITPKTRVARRDMLMWEKELLGLYVTGRPVDKFAAQLRHLPNLLNVAELRAEETFKARAVNIAGEVVGMRRIQTKSHETMVVMQIEDWHESAGTIEVVLFPKTWEKVNITFQAENDRPLDVGEIVLVRGTLDNKRGDVQVLADSVTADFDVMMPDQPQASYGDDAPAWMDKGEEGQFVASSADEPPPLFAESAPPALAPLHTPSWANAPAEPDAPSLFDDDEGATLPQKVVIAFKVNGDEARDMVRFKRLKQVLIAERGTQAVEVVLVYDDRKKRFKMAETVDYSEKLLAKLRNIDNVQAVYLEDDKA
jgi:DNA-directed DNA polymerase III PolC